MKARKRNRSAIAKKGWETRRLRKSGNEIAGDMRRMFPGPMGRFISGEVSRPSDHAPFHVPPDTVAKAYPEGFNWSVDFHQLEPGSLSAEAYARERGLGTAVEQELLAGLSDEDTAELDASNLTLRAFEGDDGTFGPTRLGPKVTMIKISGEEESFRLPPEPDPDSVETAEKLGLSVGTVKTDRSEVVDQMRIARGQVPLGPVRDRIEDELDAYKERIEKERAAERLQAQEAHAAALRATVERVLVQGFMGDMRGNADFKTQASHWLMNMDQAEAVFAALQRAGY